MSVVVSPQIRILVGPNGTAKAGRVLSTYAYSSTKSASQQLWLVPDSAALNSVHDRLLTVGDSGWLDPGVRTLAQLADALTSIDPSARRVLPRSESRRRLGSAIRTLAADGRLELLGPIASRGGLVDAVEQAISQAKSHCIGWRDFANWARTDRRTTKDREFAVVYEQYQKQLDREKLADAADRFANARASLQRNESLRWSLLVIDDFDRLPFDQWLLVADLMRRADEVLVTVLGDDHEQLDDPQRGDDLFRDPAQLVKTIVAEFPSASVEICADASSQLESHLFGNTKSKSRSSGTAIELLKASTPIDEWRQVARRVKSWIAADECRADEVVIAAATLPADAERATGVLREFGVPAAVDPPPRVQSCGALRALLDALNLKLNGWAFDDTLQVVGNRLLARLDGPAPPPTRLPTVRAAAEWTLRDMQVVRDYRAIERELARRTTCFDEDEFDDAEITERSWRALAARTAMAPLATALEALPATATPQIWSDKLEQLAAAVGLNLEPVSGNGWSVVKQALAWSALDTENQAVWSLRDLLSFLTDVATTQPLPPPIERSGRVRVVPLATADRMSCQRLVLVGMDEDALSSREPAGRVYSAHLWHTISKSSSPPAPRYSQQMLLFYRLATLPQSHLLCSYTALDAKAQLVPASPYLQELSRAEGGVLDESLRRQPSVAVLHDDAPCSRREFRRQAVSAAIRNDSSPLASASRLPEGSHLLDALDVVHDRSRGDSFGRFEGIVVGDSAKRELARSFGLGCQWSASQLETYAECPFRFMARHVLKIEPLGDLVLATDHTRRGQLAHRALWELHRRLLEQGRNSPTDLAIEDFESLYDVCVEAMLPTMQSTSADRPLVNIEAAQVRSWSASYFDQSMDYRERHSSVDMDEPLMPRYLEWRFGKPSRASADEKEDAQSTDQAFVLRVGDEEIRFGGRIDRIDVGRVGQTIVFNVIDYKAGRKVAAKTAEVRSGRRLQLPLYALAVADLLLGNEGDARPLAAGYWALRGKGFDDKSSLPMFQIEAAQVTAHSEWDRLEQDVRSRVGQLVAGIRGGEFPMFNDDEHCTSSCEYSHLCRVNQTRALGKLWPPPRADEEAAS